jgi:hypothetical protein
MRTKILICAAALAASLASSMAQNVYSLNVVGYANVTLVGTAGINSYTLVANPLDGTMGGTIPRGNQTTNFFTGVPGGSTITPWNPATAQYGSPVQYNITKGVGSWTGSLDMPPGVGLMFRNSATTNCVITFVGQVQQGTAMPVTTLGAKQSSMTGSPLPIGGNLTNSIQGLVPSSGDTLSLFNSANNQWANPAQYNVTKGVGSWTVNTQIGVGQGFLYRNAASTNNAWKVNFTVQ